MATIEKIPGVWNCTAEEYHAAADMQSRSMLQVFQEDRLRYRAMYVEGSIEPEPPTKAMITGTLSHIFVLEPERLKTDVRLIPDSVLAKNGARSTNAYRDFAAENAGKLLVKADELQLAQAIVRSVRSDEMVKKFGLLDGGHVEQSLVWQDEETGLMCKCRPDYSCPRVIVDLKTTTDTRPEAFSRTAAKMGYHFQDAFYRMGRKAVAGKAGGFVFIVVSTKPPFSVACHELDAEFRRIGEEQVRKTLNALRDCMETDDWRDPHAKQINAISPPIWLANSNRWEIPE